MRILRLAIVLMAVVLAFNDARAELVDEERLAQWESWKDDPLDLLTADAGEIALLPGSDERIAASIVALREGRAMPHDVDALLGAVGASAWVAEAWRDLVRFGAHESRWSARADLRVGAFGTDGRAEEMRVVGTVRTGPWSASMGSRSSSPAGGRRWMGAEHGPVRVFGGSLRLRTGDGLLLADGSTRTRTASVRAPRPPSLAGRSGATADDAPLAWGVEAAGTRTRAWVAAWRATHGADAFAAAAAWSGGEAVDVGGALVRAREGSRASVWAAHAPPRGGNWWGAWATGRDGVILHTGIAWSGAGWRMAGATTRATAPGRAGVDPITGSELDRPHQAWQVDGVLHQREWSIEILARETVRGRPGSATLAERSRVQLRWRPRAASRSSPRWEATVEARLDEVSTLRRGEGDPAEVSQRLSIERSERGSTTSVAWRRAGRSGARREAVTLRWAAGTGIRYSAAVALAHGERSTPWTVSQPVWGNSPLWLEPGGVAVTGSVRSAPGNAVEVGVWVWGRDGPRAGAEFGGGVAIRVRLDRSGANVAR